MNPTKNKNWIGILREQKERKTEAKLEKERFGGRNKNAAKRGNKLRVWWATVRWSCFQKWPHS
jgi:hypothetical protein